MAARLCPTCEELYPDVDYLHNCPSCPQAPRTTYKPHAVPTIHLDDADKLVRLKDTLPKFEEWLKANGRDDESLPVPHVATIHSQRHHDYVDRAKAYRVIRALEGAVIYGDTEPVSTGSLPYSKRALPVDELHLA